MQQLAARPLLEDCLLLVVPDHTRKAVFPNAAFIAGRALPPLPTVVEI
jgi:hypothetical protein